METSSSLLRPYGDGVVIQTGNHKTPAHKCMKNELNLRSVFSNTSIKIAVKINLLKFFYTFLVNFLT